jgi:hypothetical protein
MINDWGSYFFLMKEVLRDIFVFFRLLWTLLRSEIFAFSHLRPNIKRLCLQRTSCSYLNGNYFSPGLALGLVHLIGTVFLFYMLVLWDLCVTQKHLNLDSEDKHLDWRALPVYLGQHLKCLSPSENKNTMLFLFVYANYTPIFHVVSGTVFLVKMACW